MKDRKDPGSPQAQPDPDNNLGRSALFDRDERIRQRAHQIWEHEGRPEGRAQEHWERAASDLDREDADIRREGSAGEKPSVKTTDRPNTDKA